MKKSVKIAASPSGREGMDEMRQAAKQKKLTKIKHVSVREVRRFFAAIPHTNLRDRLLFDLIYRYGLRRLEACLIQIDDFDLKRNTIDVHRVKGGDSHPYPLFPETKRLLVAYLKRPRQLWSLDLFPSRQRVGAPISASLVALLFRRYAHAAGLPADRCHVHTFRHSIAMHMAEDGLDGLDVKDWLGHTAFSSTQVYMHVSARRRSKTLRRMRRSKEVL